MESLAWILIPVGLGLGAFWFFKKRGKHEADLKDKADKKATRARDDADAIQRTLDRRR
ncbi:MAG: hypothetical protein IPP07_26850 [Holophagales bacterium]|jgi:hypothetical protein|nr:hypothetical protein [Holophagales bacterium]MBK9968284.1 hypothetical protein [Holophagales bacterium]